MRFLVDAQLPKQLSDLLSERGLDSIHTLSLPQSNKTSDREISELADSENRIIISKDSDFFNDHIIRGKPKKLLFVATGNINNKRLLEIFQNNLTQIIQLFNEFNLLQIDDNSLIIIK